jgi:predicted  nucleic acid-binding Zn-ribbon protein
MIASSTAVQAVMSSVPDNNKEQLASSTDQLCTPATCDHRDRSADDIASIEVQSDQSLDKDAADNLIVRSSMAALRSDATAIQSEGPSIGPAFASLSAESEVTVSDFEPPTAAILHGQEQSDSVQPDILEGFEMTQPLVTQILMFRADVIAAVQSQVGIVPVELFFHIVGQKTELANRLASTQGDLTVARERAKNYLQELRTARSEVEAARASMGIATQELAITRGQITQLDHSKDDLQQKYDSLQEMLITVSEVNKHLSEGNSALGTDLETAQKLAERADTKLKRLRDKCCKDRQELEKDLEQKNKLMATATVLENDLKATIAERDSQVTSLQTALSAIENNHITALKSFKDESEALSSSLHSQLQLSATTNQRLTKTLAMEQISKVKAEQSALESEIKLNDSLDTKTKLEHKLEGLNTQLDAMKKERQTQQRSHGQHLRARLCQ